MTQMKIVGLSSEQEIHFLKYSRGKNTRTCQPKLKMTSGYLYYLDPLELRDQAWHSVKNMNSALAGVAQGIEYWPVNQRVTGSIPNQGTYLGCGPGPQ